MEWLTALKMLSDAGQAQTIEQLQAQINIQNEAIRGLAKGNIILAIGFGIVFFILIIGSLLETLHFKRRIKRLEAAVSRHNEKEDLVHELNAKFEKIIPLIQKAAGVTIV